MLKIIKQDPNCQRAVCEVHYVCPNCHTHHQKEEWRDPNEKVDPKCLCDACFMEKLGTLNFSNISRAEEKKRAQQEEHAVDFIQPDTYDKSKKRLVINPAFVKHYPDKLRHYYKPEEVARQGYPKLAEKMKEQKRIEARIEEAHAKRVQKGEIWPVH